MKNILKAPNNLVKKVLSKTSHVSQSSTASHELKRKINMSRHFEDEIKALKSQIEHLKAAINNLKDDSEKKDIAIANLAREKAEITMGLLKQKRSNQNLLKQLEDERKFYFKEKETYCQEINQFKKLKQALSDATPNNPLVNEAAVEPYRKEIEKIKDTLNKILEANYNISIKFLRMKNTKGFLKEELKSVKLEHQKLSCDYKTKIGELTEKLNELIQERLNSPISCSSKKYLQLVKQNSCLMYENLNLQLQVDNLNLKCEKFKLEKTKSETNNRLKYIKHETPKSSRSPRREYRRVRKKEDHMPNKSKSVPSTSTKNSVPSNEETVKIFERNELPGVPNIKMSSDFNSRTSSKQSLQKNIKKVSEKSSSKLTLFQVSRASSSTAVSSNGAGSLLRVNSSPELALKKGLG